MKKFVKRSISLVLSMVMVIGLLMVGASAADVSGNFTDIADDPCVTAIRALAKDGILSGTGNGKYSPDLTVNRAMAVTVLGRIANVMDTYSNSFTDVPGNAWYTDYVGWAAESGIVSDDGSGSFRPNAPVTGQEMSAMLAAYAELTGTAYTASNPSEEPLTRSALADMVYRVYVNEGKGDMDEGYTTFPADYSYSSVITWCVNDNAAILYGEGDAKIYGTMYYPANFDPTKTYPIVVASHGFGASSSFFGGGLPWVPELTAEGYIIYAFDFCGGAASGGWMPGSKSEGEWNDMTLLTEVDDLHSVVDFVKELDYIKNDQIFLLGQSMGGFVTAITVAEREASGKNDIAGAILLYPAFSMFNDIHNTFPTKDDLPTEPVDFAGQKNVGTRFFQDVYDLNVHDLIAGYNGNILVMHGLADAMVPYAASVEAMDQSYANNPAAELVLIAGAGHTFDGGFGGPSAAASIAVSAVKHSLAMWTEGSAQ